MITALVFALSALTPGSPVDAFTSTTSGGLSEAQIESYKERFALDDPLWMQYLAWLGRVIRGDFGYSMRTLQPISQLITNRIINTLQLMGLALFISFGTGITVGILSAVMQYSIFDQLATFIVFASLSVPSFFLGYIGIYLFSIKWSLFPLSGSMSTQIDPETASIWVLLGDRLYHLIMPATVLGVIMSALLARFTRTAMLEVLNKNYINTAKAKGLSNFKVITKHVLRNALIPVITIISNRLRWLVGGSVAIEIIFQYPGMGRLFLQSIEFRDYTTLTAATLFFCVAVLLSFLIADIVYAWANPKIRYQ